MLNLLLVHFAQIILINFRKEILPFLPKTELATPIEDPSDDCSDVLVVSESMAIAAHNEDANFALVGHTYGSSSIFLSSQVSKNSAELRILLDRDSLGDILSCPSCSYLIKGTLSNGLSYIAYTYAGELPSGAFGFNNHGLVLNCLRAEP